MNRSKLLLTILAVTGAALLWVVIRGHIPSDIEYQGQKIKLTKYYLSFEDYKDDPDNIDPSENARVAQLVARAPIERQFSDRNELIHAVFEIKFPGYGLGSFPSAPQPDGSTLELYSIEIPRADKSRFLTFRRLNGAYTLVDDFVDDDLGGINKVRLENGSLVYSLENGRHSLTHAMMK